MRFINMIPDRKQPKRDESQSGESMLKNVNAIMRVIDSLGANPSQVESLDFLVRRVERYLRQEDNFNLLNVNQATRILKTFAFAAHTNLMRVPLLEQLVRKIHQNIDTLRENDVIAILKAYQYLQSDVKFSTKLI